MMNKDLNTTHVFYMANIGDENLKEIEKVLTENYGNNSAICYTISKGYGFGTGHIQIEAMYEDHTIFMGAVKLVTETLLNAKPLWEKKEVDW